MSYSTLAKVALGLALLAIAVAAATAILFRIRRSQSANRAMTVMLALLAGAAAVSLLAAHQSQSDVQGQAHRMLSLAATAERVGMRRSGRYTTSVKTLWRLYPALYAESRKDDPTLHVDRGAAGSIRLSLWLGSGSIAERTLLPARRITARDNNKGRSLSAHA